MSALRNAVHRRPHRERSQPHERHRLGLLEKHKDYALRAADHKRKQAQLKLLRARAASRNDDEFYHGMLSRRGPGTALSRAGVSDADFKRGRRAWTGAVGGERGDGVRALSVEAVRLMKTQDLGYVRTMRAVARKEVARAEERVRGLGVRTLVGERVVFCEDEDERDMLMGDDGGEVEEEDDEEDEDEWGGIEDEEGGEQGEEDEAEVERARAERRLQHARHKLEVLMEAEQHLLEQQAKMAKTATSGGFTKKGERIKVRTRKR